MPDVCRVGWKSAADAGSLSPPQTHSTSAHARPPLRSAPLPASSCFDLFPSGVQVVEQSVLTVVKAVEDKLDEEIAVLERLDLDDLEALQERRLQQLKKAVERRTRWATLGHGEYTEIVEKEFFAAVKASHRVVCHFYRENWPCKLQSCLRTHPPQTPQCPRSLRKSQKPAATPQTPISAVGAADAEDYGVAGSTHPPLQRSWLHTSSLH